MIDVVEEVQWEPIDQLLAWIIVDKSGQEAIVAQMTPSGPQAFVFSNPALIEKTRPAVERLSKSNRRAIRLVRFRRDEVLEDWSKHVGARRDD